MFIVQAQRWQLDQHLYNLFRFLQSTQSLPSWLCFNMLKLRILQILALSSHFRLCVCPWTGVTSHLFPFITCPRPYKPYIFWKLLIQGCQNWYYQVSHTQIHKNKYTNTQIQHRPQCQKDQTCGIFLKRGLFNDIKN